MSKEVRHGPTGPVVGPALVRPQVEVFLRSFSRSTPEGNVVGARLGLLGPGV